MDKFELDRWFPPEQQQILVGKLLNRVGLTRTRAQYFVQLWVYLLVQQEALVPPLTKLAAPVGPRSLTHRQAAELFYGDQDQGSDRAAGLMIDKLAALGLLRKTFDGNTNQIEILAIPELECETRSIPIELTPDHFNPRCDAVPIANLLATNYQWMNRNFQASPHRIAQLLRGWAADYGNVKGMRVLRRCDNLNPVGFSMIFPVASACEVKFFAAPSHGLHMTEVRDRDPFLMAKPGDESCVAVFIRSWVIDAPYLNSHRADFVADAQHTLQEMRQDFPNLCDLYTMIIHPSYEPMAIALGFQKMAHTSSSIYWMYLALDRFLSLNISKTLAPLNPKRD
jgi:hypothetical protein